jgi:Xaa-Pro dipeptidase
MHTEESSLLQQQSSPPTTTTTKRISKTFTVVSIYSILITIACIVALLSFIIYVTTKHSPGGVFSRKEYPELEDYCIDVNPISATEFALRRRSLRDAIAINNIDAFIIESGTSMEYFTNTKWSRSERPFLFVITSDTCSFVVPAFEERTARERIPSQWEGDICSITIWQENESPYQLVESVIRKEPLKILNVALESETRLFICEGVAKLEHVHIHNEYNIVKQIRMIKSESEIAIMDCANRATKAAVRAVFQSGVIQAGASEQEISDELTAAMTSAGLNNIWSIVLFGANAAFPHGTSQKHPLTNSDLILIDTGGALYDYQSDLTRTFGTKRGFAVKNETLVHSWNIVKAAQLAALNAIKPGVTSSVVDAAARNVIIQAGFGPEFRFFTHRTGHGIGMNGHEHPYIVPSSSMDIVLKPGMVFSVEPGIYVTNDYGIRIEDIVRVTEDGYEVFGELSPTIDDPFAGH